jgi:hypothetical protein
MNNILFFLSKIVSLGMSLSVSVPLERGVTRSKTSLYVCQRVTYPQNLIQQGFEDDTQGMSTEGGSVSPQIVSPGVSLISARAVILTTTGQFFHSRNKMMSYADSLARLAVQSSRKKKNHEACLPLPQKELGSFDVPDPCEEAERDYQDALDKFKAALKKMPEWLAWEKARKEWTHLFDLEGARIRNEALKTYTEACNVLPEWQTYFEAFKRRDDVVRMGIRT